MSGWDVSSTPTWGPQDGPEDSHPGHGEGSRDFGQDFGPRDFGRGGPSSPAGGFPEVGGGFPGESQAGGPPPEFFGQDYSQEHEVGPGGFPQRTPGRSFQDLPRRESRGRHSSVPGGGYGQENGFGQDGAFGQDNGYGRGQEAAFGQENGYGRGQDAAFGQENGYGQDNGFGHGQDGAFGHENGNFGQDNGGFGQENSHGNQDGGYREWGGNTDQAETWGPGGGQDNDGGWGQPAGRSAAPWEERPQQDAGYPGPDGGQPDFGQPEFGRQEYPRQAPRPSFGGPDYDGQDFPGQQEPDPGFDRGGERDVTARMDPALQDFFAPQRGGGGGYPGQGPGRSGEPRDPSRYRPPTDGWEDPGRSRGGTGPRPASRGPRRDEPEPRGGIGMRGLIAIGAVVAVIVVIAVVVLTHKSGGGTPAASSTPSGGTVTSPAAKPSASKAAGSGTATKPAGGTAAAAGAFTLSTPATAGGYAMGQDPNFLAASTATAKQITDAVTAGGGGTLKGNPVSAAYRLGLGQVITFVGYTGTFTPAKVQTILATLSNDPKAYPAGANGGLLGCANTKATPSGAVCVWATDSTLGVTEFYSATGPETLNAAQAKGATDTVNLRADVEKKK